jgi:trigger factor
MVKLEELDAADQLVENGINSDTTVSIEYVKDDATRNTLVNLKAGDSVIVDPEKISDNHEDLAKMLGITHHDVHHLHGNFKLTVKSVSQMEPHELNEELFGKYYPKEEIQTEEQFREKIKSEMIESFDKDTKWLFRKTFVKEIVNRINPQLPDEFLKKWISMTNEKPINPEELDYIYPSQAFQLKWQLIENKITREHQVKVELQDAMNYLKDSMKKQFEAYNIPMDEAFLEQSAKEYLGDREKAAKVYENLHEEKMFDVIMQLCTLVEKPISYDEFVHKVQH